MNNRFILVSFIALILTSIIEFSPKELVFLTIFTVVFCFFNFSNITGSRFRLLQIAITGLLLVVNFLLGLGIGTPYITGIILLLVLGLLTRLIVAQLASLKHTSRTL